MAKSKLPEDRGVLRAKYENADRLVQAYADGAQRIEAKLDTLLILETDPTAEQILEAAKEALVPLSETGVDTSLIDDDLEKIRVSVADDFQSYLAQCWGIMTKAQQGAASAIASPDPAASAFLYKRVWEFVLAQIAFIRLVAFPARTLRQELASLLNRQPNEKVETAGQNTRKLRDERIHFLSQQYKTSSPARLMVLIAADPILMQLRQANVRVTTDIVRNLLRPRDNARRGGRAKNTSQGKKKNSHHTRPGSSR